MKKLILLVITFFSFGMCEIPNRENCVLKEIKEWPSKFPVSKDYSFVCSNDSLVFRTHYDTGRITEVEIWSYDKNKETTNYIKIGHCDNGFDCTKQEVKDKYGVLIWYKEEITTHNSNYIGMVIEWNRVKYAIDNEPTDTDDDYEPDGGWYCDKHDCPPSWLDSDGCCKKGW